MVRLQAIVRRLKGLITSSGAHFLSRHFLSRHFLSRMGIAALISGLAVTVTAADADAIKYRQAVYSSIGGNMTAMVNIVKGEVPHLEHLPTLARTLAELAELTSDIFPENSQEGKTDALPDIWEKPDEFNEHLTKFQSAAHELAEVAGTQDMQAFTQAFQQLGKTCKSCHDKFRAE